jgi:NAD(P)-dependent dehydrogenase (short-subunit alcohol dehydrogenase family)
MLAIDTARALLEHGVSGLALLDLPTALKSGASAINALRAEFPSVTIMAESCDVTDAEGMVTVVQKIRDQLGPLGTLCCFAGMAKCVSSADMDVNEWRRVLEVNTTGCWLSAQAVGKYGFTLSYSRFRGTNDQIDI